MSKFTNAFLAFGLLAYLIATPKGRAYLLTGLPYMAVTAAILPLLPYLFWNLQNDWLRLERQGARLVASGFSPRYLGGYAALLLLAPTPLVTWFAFRALKALPKDYALLIWSSVPLLLYFTYHATHAPVQANWIVPLQACVAIAATFGLVQAQSPRLWIKATLAGALLLSVGSVATAFNPATPDRHDRQSTKPNARMVSDTRRHHRPAAGNGRQMDRHDRLRSNRIARPSFSSNARLVRL
ncbi:hypothetical protein [Pseudorhizobium pelagicum]|uniref:hypothetical protein n=1 Tax=Pseudorhizobium pelagicum TaxID=1509405 RepID=UPI001111178E|nr:hypothetical protein [Pseudorhizobium pelagicum]